jgi:hypothetical protein
MIYSHITYTAIFESTFSMVSLLKLRQLHQWSLRVGFLQALVQSVVLFVALSTNVFPDLRSVAIYSDVSSAFAALMLGVSIWFIPRFILLRHLAVQKAINLCGFPIAIVVSELFGLILFPEMSTPKSHLVAPFVYSMISVGIVVWYLIDDKVRGDFDWNVTDEEVPLPVRERN